MIVENAPLGRKVAVRVAGDASKTLQKSKTGSKLPEGIVGRFGQPLRFVSVIASLVGLVLPSGRAFGALPEERDAAPTVTFEQAIERALAENPTLGVAQERFRRAAALLEQTRSASLPTLAAVGTYLRLDADRVFFNTVTSAKDQLNGTATLTVPIISPQSWANWSRSKRDVAVARADVDGARWQIAAATASAYLSVIAQKHIYEAVARAHEAAVAHYDYTYSRYEGGIGNRLDAVRAEKEVSDDLGRMAAAETAVVQAREVLGVLMASPGPIDVADTARLPTLPTQEDALHDVPIRRPDLVAMKRRVDAAQKSFDLNWTDYVPFVSGMFQPFLQTPVTASIPVPRGWQAQLILTLPIYDGGLRYGQGRERKSALETAKWNVDAALRQARSDVRTAFKSMLLADEALASSRRAATLGAEAVTLAVKAYQGGATTNIEVIDAVRQSRDADTQVAIAENTARQSRISLLAASGHFP